MNNLPAEIIHYIGIQLSIPELKQLCMSNSYLQDSINTIHFWKLYIKQYFKEYKVCDQNLVLEQIKYLHKINTRNRIGFYDIDTKENEINQEQLIKLTSEFKLRDGDLIRMNYDNNKFWYYWHGCFLKSENSSNKVHEKPIPKEICIIDEIPIEFYMNLGIPQIISYQFYFDIEPYMDQIKSNLEKTVFGTYTIYHTKFIHKYGKEYRIVIDEKPIDDIIKDISKGYFVYMQGLLILFLPY